MVFISGVHGVGKSYFCNMAKKRLGINTFSASQLIKERKRSEFSREKLIPDIDDNQQYLLMAIQDLNATDPNYLLDGHFCLLNAEGQITRIPKDIFIKLNPNAIVLLTEKPNIIAERRRNRDGIAQCANNIQQFQKMETAYAREVAQVINSPLKISAGQNDFESTLDFVREIMRRNNNGW